MTKLSTRITLNIGDLDTMIEALDTLFYVIKESSPYHERELLSREQIICKRLLQRLERSRSRLPGHNNLPVS
jgi:hypothetical protein